MNKDSFAEVFSAISIQREDFSIEEELAKLTVNTRTGALVSFVGLVRGDTVNGDEVSSVEESADEESPEQIQALSLEHYPGMCEKQIQSHINLAVKRWPLLAVSVVHRIGRLNIGEQIVLVAVSSEHRKSAFHAAEFIMDYLKNEAPFWKQHHTKKGDYWVSANDKDKEALKLWSKNS